ncbi:hypothetical protein Drorol1_Dr00001494 [Drosera rotundifolia]
MYTMRYISFIDFCRSCLLFQRKACFLSLCFCLLNPLHYSTYWWSKTLRKKQGVPKLKPKSTWAVGNGGDGVPKVMQYHCSSVSIYINVALVFYIYTYCYNSDCSSVKPCTFSFCSHP